MKNKTKKITRIYKSILIKSLNCVKIDLLHQLQVLTSTDTTTNHKSLNLFLIVELWLILIPCNIILYWLKILIVHVGLHALVLLFSFSHSWIIVFTSFSEFLVHRGKFGGFKVFFFILWLRLYLLYRNPTT